MEKRGSELPNREDYIFFDLVAGCEEMIAGARENIKKGVVAVPWNGYDRMYQALQEFHKIEKTKENA